MEKPDTELVQEHTLFTISVVIDGAKKLLKAFPNSSGEDMIAYMERLKRQLTIEYMEKNHSHDRLNS